MQRNVTSESLTDELIVDLLCGRSESKHTLQLVVLENLCRIYINYVDPFPLRIAWFELEQQALKDHEHFDVLWECSHSIKDLALASMAQQKNELQKLMAYTEQLQEECKSRERKLIMKFADMIKNARNNEDNEDNHHINYEDESDVGTDEQKQQEGVNSSAVSDTDESAVSDEFMQIKEEFPMKALSASPTADASPESAGEDDSHRRSSHESSETVSE